VPLGILMMALLAQFEGGAGRTGQWIAVLIAFSFSLGIEIFQAWIPSRDSSSLDLLLNTMGGFLGVVVYCRLVRRL
jgi:glycopeptide antibiotics resistance protein